MAEGFVKWFNEKEGYGFIERRNDEEIFFSFSSVIKATRFEALHRGDLVKFNIEEGVRGPVAKNIRKM